MYSNYGEARDVVIVVAAAATDDDDDDDDNDDDDDDDDDDDGDTALDCYCGDFCLSGAPEISGGSLWEHQGGYNLGGDFGGDFDSGVGLF